MMEVYFDGDKNFVKDTTFSKENVWDYYINIKL